MDRISDEKLDWLIHDCQYNGIETEVNAAGSDDDRDYDCDDLIAALQELKERRVADKYSCETIKKDENGKCIGYQKSDIDDEPTEKCMECSKNVFYEE